MKFHSENNSHQKCDVKFFLFNIRINEIQKCKFDKNNFKLKKMKMDFNKNEINSF